MSLFKHYRIRGHNLVFTRIEALDDDYICDLCKYQEQCGHTNTYSYVIKSQVHKKGNKT